MSKLIVTILMIMPVLLWANKRTYTTKKIGTPIIIDGDLNDVAWQTANWSTDFTMFYPYDNKPATKKTSFAIIYDEDFLYVAMKAYDDEPEKIVKRLTRRDDIDGDWMGLQFDSYHDLQTSYEFKVSAAGTKRDMYTSGNGNKQDGSWDAIWWAKTTITDDGWVAEMKIPFSQLRFVNKDVQTWGLQLGRYVQRDEEISLWVQKKRDDAGWVHHFGEMDGIVDIKPKKVFDLYPYAVGSVNTYKPDDGNPFLDGTDFNGNVGLDGKVGLTNNLTLDFSINPDFGQVEADPSSVNLSGFELFFDERRPFFVEGSSIMNFPIMFNDGGHGHENLFYSRRIGRSPHHYPDLIDSDTLTEYSDQPNFTRILGAAKVTGRTNKGLSIGILESVTAKEFADVKDSDGSARREVVEPLTNYAAVSLEQDFNKGNTLLGGMFTSTNRLIDDESLEFLHKNAYSGGLKFTRYFKDKTWYFSSKAHFSYVEGTTEAITNTQESSNHLFNRPGANHLKYDTTRTSLAGSGGNIFFGKSGGGRIRFMSALIVKSPGLELNDIGFSRHVDEIVEVLWFGYEINEPIGIFKEMSYGIDQWSSSDFSGQFMSMGGSFNARTTFKNNYALQTGINVQAKDNSTSYLRGGPTYTKPGEVGGWIWVGSDSRKMLRVYLNSWYFRGFEGWFDAWQARTGFTVKPWKFLELMAEVMYNPRINNQQYITDVDFGDEKRYILGSIDQRTLNTSLRINYNITPDMSLQYWGQPFFGTGEYSDFKYVSSTPMAKEYTNRFNLYTDNQLWFDEESDMYKIDENSDGIEDYTFENPDFNNKIFLSNMVFRWEYRPGSVLFLVWSQNRENYDLVENQSFANNLENMFNFKPHDTFLIKLSYRIGL